jgi:hypothetical protein
MKNIHPSNDMGDERYRMELIAAEIEKRIFKGHNPEDPIPFNPTLTSGTMTFRCEHCSASLPMKPFRVSKLGSYRLTIARIQSEPGFQPPLHDSSTSIKRAIDQRLP